MRRAFEAPTASAASTYSRTLCFMYSARTSRKIPVQPVRPRIRITVSTPFWFTTAATASTSSRYGIEVKTLYTQLKRSSTYPPRYPASAPKSVPRKVASVAAASPTKSEVSVPFTTFLTTSRPHLSPPNARVGARASSGDAPDRPLAISARSAASGSAMP